MKYKLNIDAGGIFSKYMNVVQNLNYGNDYFVASDNDESVDKLKNILGGRIKYLPNLIRGKTEEENTSKLQLNNFENPFFWEESFIEMLLL